ncbi:hypothetical protein JKP88DRAFT_174699 [Tribonema minus]|uniref:Helicase ATP-binding domain-containing protein n=1 Tax=Tribonema minus TaxID=303371 RepID=A0A835ZLZ6_9STRA|nr:hypothetical protein JKP88DRAFT_174699 [Tribonema minus]
MLKSGKATKARVKAAAKTAGKTESEIEAKVMTAPYDMFKDLVTRCPEFVDSIAKLGRPLRVAAMCSGTESPLLALGMISRAVKEVYDVDFAIEHVFSCEIEPIKASYIQRNFAPPILFRDVRELGGDKATTAYGAMVDVPGEVDMLVAGTSCVDYSNLNNDKKSIDGGGESGQTFHGMLNWVKRNKPPIVILENVCSAPWESVVQRFKKIGFSAGFARLDTKAHYIPHTRTRGYLFASLDGDADVPARWKSGIKKLECPSNSTLEAFLLPNDDSRISAARAKLAKSWDASRTRSRVDWSRCESRHSRARLDEQLGSKRPLTGWEEGGLCTLPDFAWNDWGQAQTDRVLDLMGINFIRMAKLGADPSYKTLVWNLSQNVDRSTASSKMGICPCLTPSMVPYITNRGGPVIGLEALSLQGIPVDDLILTRETEDNLADLAGNAMTTTVVGTAMVVALGLCIDGLRASPWAEAGVLNAKGAMEVDSSRPGALLITDPVDMTSFPLDLTPLVVPSTVADLIDMALRSARMCCCEGRDSITDSTMLRCSDCGHTCCERCSGRPEHAYTEVVVARVSPALFRKALKDAMPMIVLFEMILGDTDGSLGGHFYFTSLERTDAWRALYTSPSSGTRLELVIRAGEAEWSAYAETSWRRDDDMAGASFARMKVRHDATSLISGGTWELRDTGIIVKRPLRIEGSGERVDSWETIIGLQGDDVSGKQQWSHLTVSGDLEEARGTYELLPKCGGALGMLHRRVDDDAAARRMFLFIDPTRCGKPQDDEFVFSASAERLNYGQTRDIIAHLPRGWRMSEEPGDVSSTRHKSWEEALLSIKTAACAAVVSHPSRSAFTSPSGCEAYSVCLACSVPVLAAGDASMWGDGGTWATIASNSFRATLSPLAHITERIRLPAHIDQWSQDHAACDPLCSTCAPREPSLRWVKTSRGKLEPVENIIEAGVYEQALKRRPAPFVVQLMHDRDAGTGNMRIAINGVTLMHRATGALSEVTRGDAPISCSWRVVDDCDEQPRPAAFTLDSNRDDDPCEQPPHFVRYPLRPEQLRSLSWMLKQEQSVEPFIEEEVCEAVGALGWRAEGRAQRCVPVNGGVLADEVGYGKTAVTLGLIDSTPSLCPPDDFGRVSLSATLIVAPPHLMKQWPSEVAKFAGTSLRVKLIKTLSDMSRLTVADMQHSNLVVVAATVFRSDLYFERFTKFTGGKTLPARYGRMFGLIYSDSLDRMRERVEWLKTGEQKGVGRFADALRADEAERDAAKNTNEEGDDIQHFINKKAAYAGDKRKKGKSAPPPAALHDADGDTTESDASGPAKKQKRRPNKKPKRTDPFAMDKMLTAWELMTSPPLEMFKWQRIVVDEYTYLGGEDKMAVNSISAVNRWCLSGTPPTSCFEDINCMAAFLGVSLGVSEPQRNRKDITQGEKFRFFQNVNTAAWHMRRQGIAQSFLHRFVRQNIAEIDEIPFEETRVVVTLPSAERAIYIELEAHLQALDMKSAKTIKSSKVANGDRDVQLRSILGSSATPEEALMKRCAHFDIEGGSESAEQACQVIVELRGDQFKSCVGDLERSVMKARALRAAIVEHDSDYETDTSDPLARWVASLQSGGGDGGGGAGVGDKDGGDMLHEVVQKAMAKPVEPTDDDGDDIDIGDRKYNLREAVHGLRRLTKEVVGRMRSLRYFKAVRDLQSTAAEVAECAGCGLPPTEPSILSTCGHTGCHSCLIEHAEKQECCTDGCGAPARVTAVVKAKDLGETSASASGRFGAKLTSLLETIAAVPADERILLFVQFADLMQLVTAVLQESGIKALQLKGSVHTKISAMEQFQKPGGDVRVLLLDLAGESASGANLTVANHIMFLHPVLLPTPHERAAVETQAIGRVVRYGQTKLVKIWRFIAANTIDTDVCGQLRAPTV